MIFFLSVFPWHKKGINNVIIKINEKGKNISISINISPTGVLNVDISILEFYDLSITILNILTSRIIPNFRS